MWRVWIVFLIIALCGRGGLLRLCEMNSEQRDAEYTERYDEEVSEMKREIVIVKRIEEQCFYVENMKGEQYRIDASFNKDFPLEQTCIMLYEKREAVSDGLYAVEPKSISAMSNAVVHPIHR